MNPRGTYGNGVNYGRILIGDSEDDALRQAEIDVAPIDAQIKELSLKWHPTGRYQPAEMDKMLAMVLSTARKAVELVKEAPLTTADAETVNKQLIGPHGNLTMALAGSQKFVAASETAKRSGTLVDAPDFKKWVIYTMQAASQAIGHASILASNRSWIKQAIRVFMPFLVPMAEFLMKVGGAVKDVVTSAAASTWTFLKPVAYVAVGLIGVVALSSVVKRSN